MDAHARLTRTTVALHWLIAIAMIGSLILGLVVEEMERGPDKFMLIGLHKSVGVLVLVVAAYRFIWRLREGFPKRLTPVADWQERVTSVVHWLLLLGTLLLPLSGIAMSVGGGYPVGVFGFELIAGGDKNELLGEAGHIVHGLGGKIMIAAVLLHVAASFKHALVTRDGTLRRILGGTAG